jgi:hypothetical protein
MHFMMLNDIYIKEYSVNLHEKPNTEKPTHVILNAETYTTSPTATASSGNTDLHDEYTMPTDSEAAVTEVPHKINPDSSPSAPSASTRRRNAQKPTSESHGPLKETRPDRQGRKNQ